MAKQNLPVALLEKEIRRLNMLGQKTQEEANIRRFFLAAVLRKVGPITLTQADIAELRDMLKSGDADLKVEGLPEEGVLLSLTMKNGKEHGLAARLEPDAPAPWWKRLLARAKLWWWGIRLKAGE